MRKRVACVMGDIDLVRSLGLAGIPCAVVARPGAAPRFSRFTRAVLEWADAWTRPEALVATLVRFAAAQPEPPTLFYQEDRELLLVSRHRDQLAPVFRFVAPDPSLVEALVDKAQFQLLAARLGLPVPPARQLRPGDQTAAAALDLRFPIVLKPLTRRTDQWEPLGGSGKALQVQNPAELSRLWPRLAAANLELLAQELIPGPETRIESCHVYVDGDGEIVASFTGQKIRTWPRHYGHSTALTITDAPDVAALGRELVSQLQLRGVAKFDFKRGPDGTLYLLEVNPRFTLWHYPGAVAGVNIPALVHGDLVGLPRPAIPRARAGVTWCKVWSDVAAARESGVPLWKWMPWALRCEAKRAVAWDDPLPLLVAGVWECARRAIALVRGASAAAHAVNPVNAR